jgi:gamma-glutamylcyclotransferase (GGCT)/AIG2-like uncharacterized protein YtfP
LKHEQTTKRIFVYGREIRGKDLKPKLWADMYRLASPEKQACKQLDTIREYYPNNLHGKEKTKTTMEYCCHKKLNN